MSDTIQINRPCRQINRPCRIDANRSSYHGRNGVIKKALLDHEGRLTSAQIEIDGERIWFAASAIVLTEEQTA